MSKYAIIKLLCPLFTDDITKVNDCRLRFIGINDKVCLGLDVST